MSEDTKQRPEEDSSEYLAKMAKRYSTIAETLVWIAVLGSIVSVILAALTRHSEFFVFIVIAVALMVFAFDAAHESKNYRIDLEHKRYS